MSTEIIQMDYPTDVGRPMIVGKSDSARPKLLRVMKKAVAFKYLSNKEVEAMFNSF